MTLRVPPAPARQRMAALATANDIRITRAALKHDLRSLPRMEGRKHLAAILDNVPDFIQTAKVGDVLHWPRFMGDYAARRICHEAGIPPAKRLGELTDRQRAALAAALLAPCPMEADAA